MSADTILTLANGRGVDLLNPKPADIDFIVMAEQLAKEPRYNGATPHCIFSVAQHVCLGVDAILRDSGDRELAAYFLLHDGHEHTLKDDTTPKKRAIAAIAAQRFGVLADQIMEAFALLTDRHDAAIHQAAGLAWPPSEWRQKQIKEYDLRAFVAEWRDLMPGVEHPNWAPYADIRPLSRSVWPLWNWQRARNEFYDRCLQLLPALQEQAA